VKRKDVYGRGKKKKKSKENGYDTLREAYVMKNAASNALEGKERS